MRAKRSSHPYKPGHGKFAVLGLGSFGLTVARQLQELGNEVLAVDKDEHRINSLAEEFTQVIAADVSDERALEELGVGGFDVAIVAIGESLESNVLCTLALKQLGVPRVWVKAVSAPHHRILGRLGADRIVHPEYEIGIHVAYSLNYPYVLDYISLGNDYFVVELELTESFDGKALADVDLEGRFSIQFLALKRGGRLLEQDVERTPMAKGDTLVVLGKQAQLQALSEIL